MTDQQFAYLPGEVPLPPMEESVTTDLRGDRAALDPAPDLDLSAYIASRREARGARLTVRLAADFSVHPLPYVPAAPFIDAIVTGQGDAEAAVAFLRQVLAPGEMEALQDWIRTADLDLATFDWMANQIVEVITGRPTDPPPTSR